MRRVNIADPPFEHDPEDPGRFAAGMFRFGKLLGAVETGASVYEILPGHTTSPYHYEYAEEEWLLVLAGRPTLRTPEGREPLAPLDVVFFPCGPEGAHAVYNETDETVRVLMWGQNKTPAATAYPDSDKVGMWMGSGEGLMVRRSSEVSYYDGEQP